MSDDSNADDDDEFFDQSSSKREVDGKAVAERRSSPAHESQHANASGSRQRGHRSDASDESSSDHSSSSEEKETSTGGQRNQRPSSSSAKYDVVIPSESADSHQVDDEDRAGGSKTPEEGSTAHEESARKQPQKSKKVTGSERRAKNAADLESKGRGRKLSSRSSTSTYSRSDSSDEEERNSESRHSKRPASTASGINHAQQLAVYTNLRALSAPVHRRSARQSRQVSGFSTGSRMDVKALLESLLQAENSRPRRVKSAAGGPLEFQRRRNYTFSDTKLDSIERENRRLLEKIVTIHYTQPTYGRAEGQKRAASERRTFPDIARMKQLEKIEKENMV